MKATIAGAWWTVAALCCIPGSASALEVISTLNYTADHTDNTLLTEDNKISDWIHNPGVDVYASHDTASLNLLADYDYVRQIYDKSYWDDQNLVSGTASIGWEAIAERLDFNVRNVVTQSALRASGPATPDNRQSVSYTEVGPTLRFQPRRGDELQFEYLYTDVSVQTTDSDSARNTGTGRYIVGLSENRSIILDGSYTDVNFDNPFSADLKTLTTTVAYRQTGTTLDMELTAGYSDFDRDGLDSVSGGIYLFDLTWRRSPTSSLSLIGGESIRDSSSELTSGGGGGGETSPDNSELNEVFTERRAELSWSQEIGQTRATLGGFYREENYEDVPRDNDGAGAYLRLSRDLSRRTSLAASIEFSNRDFTDEADSQDELRAELNLTHRIGYRLALHAGVRYEDRDADLTESYSEWLASIGLSYTFWGNRDSRP